MRKSGEKKLKNAGPLSNGFLFVFLKHISFEILNTLNTWRVPWNLPKKVVINFLSHSFYFSQFFQFIWNCLSFLYVFGAGKSSQVHQRMKTSGREIRNICTPYFCLKNLWILSHVFIVLFVYCPNILWGWFGVLSFRNYCSLGGSYCCVK